MATEHTPDLQKTGKRGKYSEGDKVNFQLDNTGSYWIVNRQRKSEDLKTIDKQRAKSTKIINEIRKELKSEIRTKEPKINDKEAIAIVNFQVYGTFKKRQPRGFSFSPESAKKLNEAKAEYNRRKPLDEQSKAIRKVESKDKSFRKIYDVLRNARKHNKAEVFIGGELLPIATIEEVDASGRVIQRNFPNKEGIPLVKEGEELKRPKAVVSYRVSTKTIAPLGKTNLAVDVSLEKVTKTTYTEEKTKQKLPPASNKIIFIHEGTEFVTNSRIDQLFNNAQKQTGDRILFLNNEGFDESYFYKGDDGKWRLQAFAFEEINAPEIEGIISVRYDYTYHKRFRILQSTTVTSTQQTKTYGEINSTITILGKDVPITVEVETEEAFLALKDSRKLNKAAGSSVFSVASTDFTIEKVGNRYVVRLRKVISGKAIPNSDLQPIQSKDEFIILSWVSDKSKSLRTYLITLKSPTLELTSSLADFEESP